MKWNSFFNEILIKIPKPSWIYFIFLFFKLYFTHYTITVAPILPTFPLPHNTLYVLRQPPHHCSCPWVMRISSLVTPFPILYFTSPWLFCNYIFFLLNLLTSSPILPYTPTMWQLWKPSPYPCSCLCSSCLLSLFLRFNCW